MSKKRERIERAESEHEVRMMKVPEYVSRIAEIGRKIVTLHYYFRLLDVTGDWVQRKWGPQGRMETMNDYFQETDPEKSRE